MEIYAIIMAGGVGARFWPQSREKNPKQLLKIFSDSSLVQDTVGRLKGIVDDDKIFVITNKMQKDAVIEQLISVPKENVVAEPFGRNTAACIGLASVLVKHKSDDAVMLVLPADHLITDIAKFQNTIINAAEFADRNKALMTIGINPTRPETGYGYIQSAQAVLNDTIFKVKTFAEKPNIETARRFIDAGDFFWNSGMFVWKVSTILHEIKMHMPDLYDGVMEIENNIDRKDFEKVLSHVYGQLRSISIDYGIMEKTKNAFLIKGSFDWSDVGSWEAVYQLSSKDNNGNVRKGDVFLENTGGSYIHSNGKFTAVIGGKNIIVIDTEDALLICDRERAQEVKHIIDYLRMHKRNELL